VIGGAWVLGLIGWAMAGCAAAAAPSKLARPVPAPAAAAAVTAEASRPTERPPSTMRLVAVTDASDFALQPRMLRDDQVIVPLPPERAHLAKVEVNLLVTRRDTGEIMAQQKKTFSWKTQGPALRFYLPVLPGGDYLAQVRTKSTIVAKTGDTAREVQLPDQAQVSLHSDRASQVQRSSEFRYHFKLHHAVQDTPELTQDRPDDAALDLRILQLETKLHNNEVTKITLDCWASSDGEADYNMHVSIKRCKWVRSNVLAQALGPAMSANVIEAAHGEDNPPEPEPASIPDDALQEIRKRNRVVILKVYTTN
jgi:outer membrane protein OmpA-like peptidoglycan-associated protein